MAWFTIDILLRDLPYITADTLLNKFVIQTPRGLRGDQPLISRELSAVFLANPASSFVKN